MVYGVKAAMVCCPEQIIINLQEGSFSVVPLPVGELVCWHADGFVPVL